MKLGEAIVKINESSAGELLLNDIMLEGTFKGYNLALVKQVAEQIQIPLIANCGAASNQDFQQAIANGASAAAASSVFVYKNNNPQSKLINYSNINFFI